MLYLELVVIFHINLEYDLVDLKAQNWSQILKIHVFYSYFSSQLYWDNSWNIAPFFKEESEMVHMNSSSFIFTLVCDTVHIDVNVWSFLVKDNTAVWIKIFIFYEG